MHATPSGRARQYRRLRRRRAQPGRPYYPSLQCRLRSPGRDGAARLQRHPHAPDDLGQGDEPDDAGGRRLLSRAGRGHGGEVGGLRACRHCRRRGVERRRRGAGDRRERARRRPYRAARHQPAGQSLRHRADVRRRHRRLDDDAGRRGHRQHHGARRVDLRDDGAYRGAHRRHGGQLGRSGASLAGGAATAGAAAGGGGFFSWLGGLFSFAEGGIVPSAAGGWAVPNLAGATPALLHAREMVLPADISPGSAGHDRRRRCRRRAFPCAFPWARRRAVGQPLVPREPQEQCRRAARPVPPERADPRNF